jgi:hypothetical protein
MPSVRYPSVLRAVYKEVSRLIALRGPVPTELVLGDPDLYRSFPIKYFTPNKDGIFPRTQANQAALVIRDEASDTNRFSGQPLTADVPASGGLYCTFGQPALIAEVLHYSRVNRDGTINRTIRRETRTGFPVPGEALAEKCIVRLRLMHSVMALDLSEHNPGSLAFVKQIERSHAVQGAIDLAHAPPVPLWDWIFDGWDYSVARGIGLAVASCDYLSALRVRSARHGSRSPEESGDTLIFFGRDGTQVSCLSIVESCLIPARGKPVLYPVEFVP